MRYEKEKTSIWRKYEKCQEYADKKAIVSKTNRFWNFYVGRQWEGINTGGEELPMLNIIKPIVQYKVSNVASATMTAQYSDMTGSGFLDNVYESLNKYWEQSWEKSKMNSTMWRVLKAAAIQGDSYAYWQDGDTTKPPMILANTDMFFANENHSDLQTQEFIIIKERWSMEEAKKLAEENGVSKEEIELIGSDNLTEKQLFNKTEVEDKVTVLFYMTKNEKGEVEVARTTKMVVIQPQDAVRGTSKEGSPELKALTVYPIVNFVWEDVPYSARGISEVEQLLPNQLELNKTLARRSMATKMGAFPRLAYDSNAVDNPEDLEKVGAAIAVNGGNAQSINQMISYLNPASISSDAYQLCNDLIQTTKDLSGVTDYAIGNINPEKASGTAINAVREQSQIPLAEQAAKVRQFVEDVSLLWADLWIAFNSNGMDVSYEEDLEQDMIDPASGQIFKAGESVPRNIHLDVEDLQKLKPTVRVDVSPDNEWTKLGEQQALDSFFQTGQITLEEYAIMSPKNSPIPKDKILKAVDVRKKEEQRQAQMQMQQQQMANDQQMALEGQKQVAEENKIRLQNGIDEQNAQDERQSEMNALVEEIMSQGYSIDEAMDMIREYADR